MATIVEVTDANNPYLLGSEGLIDPDGWPHFEVDLRLKIDNAIINTTGEGIVDISGPHAFSMDVTGSSVEIRSITGGTESLPNEITIGWEGGLFIDSSVSSEALGNLTINVHTSDSSAVLDLYANNLPTDPEHALTMTGLEWREEYGNAIDIRLHGVAAPVSARLEDGLTSFYDADNNKVAQFNIVGMDEKRLSQIEFSSSGISLQCFARGTKIATPNGEVAVEDFKPGDTVLTVEGDIRTVKWVGHRSIDTTTIPPDQTLVAFPVRFAANSLSEGIPLRDLVVSPWHHFYFEGYLVPAVLLVNGKTIVQDFTVKSVDYFHLELDKFDILISERAPTESYYDTGNRSMFSNAPVTALLPSIKICPKRPGQWKDRVLGKGPIIEAIKEKLLQRAEQLMGFTRVDDPLLHLTIGAAHEPLWPRAVVNGTYEFVLPESAMGEDVHIRSRCAAAREMAAHAGKDLRQLGVALDSICVRGTLGNRDVDLNDSTIRGLHPMEVKTKRRVSLRWTDGDCVLPAQVVGSMSGEETLTVSVAKTYKYWHKIAEEVVESSHVYAQVGT